MDGVDAVVVWYACVSARLRDARVIVRGDAPHGDQTREYLAADHVHNPSRAHGSGDFRRGV